MLRSRHDRAHAQEHAHNRNQPASSFVCCCLFVALQLCGGGVGAAELQPLPPNIGMSLAVEVAGTTKATDAFWAEHCQKIPSNAKCIVVEMVDVSIEI